MMVITMMMMIMMTMMMMIMRIEKICDVVNKSSIKETVV